MSAVRNLLFPTQLDQPTRDNVHHPFSITVELLKKYLGVLMQDLVGGVCGLFLEQSGLQDLGFSTTLPH